MVIVMAKQSLIGRPVIHGHSIGEFSSEYYVWRGMIGRCRNESEPSYKNYGGRGIDVCERWANSFESFLSDMGARPTGDYQIDREDNDGDYAPDNCRWATRSMQMHNKRIPRNNKSGLIGVAWNNSSCRWHAYFMFNGIQVCNVTSRSFFEACCARKSAENEYRPKVFDITPEELEK